MTTDPTPQDTVFYFGAERAIVQTDSHGPILADLLKMERWMTWIRNKQLVVAFCEFSDFRW